MLLCPLVFSSSDVIPVCAQIFCGLPCLAQENSRLHCNNEEQELTEIDILVKQLRDSKTEQDKMNATIQKLIKLTERFQER